MKETEQTMFNIMHEDRVITTYNDYHTACTVARRMSAGNGGGRKMVVNKVTTIIKTEQVAVFDG